MKNESTPKMIHLKMTIQTYRSNQSIYNFSKLTAGLNQLTVGFIERTFFFVIHTSVQKANKRAHYLE